MQVERLGKHGEDAVPDGKTAMAPDGGRRRGEDLGAPEAVDGGAASFLSGPAALGRRFRGGLGSLASLDAGLVCAGKAGSAEGRDKRQKQACGGRSHGLSSLPCQARHSFRPEAIWPRSPAGSPGRGTSRPDRRRRWNPASAAPPCRGSASWHRRPDSPAPASSPPGWA